MPAARTVAETSSTNVVLDIAASSARTGLATTITKSTRPLALVRTALTVTIEHTLPSRRTSRLVSARRDAGGTHERHRLMVLLSFFVAFTWAASAIMTKPAMSELSPLAAQSFRMPILSGFLWLMPWSRAGLPEFIAAGRSMVAPMVILSALTVVSAMTWIAGLKYADVIVATVLSSTSPMFALGLGALFLGERLSVAAVLGALLTIAGIVVLDI